MTLVPAPSSWMTGCDQVGCSPLKGEPFGDHSIAVVADLPQREGNRSAGRAGRALEVRKRRRPPRRKTSASLNAWEPTGHRRSSLSDHRILSGRCCWRRRRQSSRRSRLALALASCFLLRTCLYSPSTFTRSVASRESSVSPAGYPAPLRLHRTCTSTNLLHLKHRLFREITRQYLIWPRAYQTSYK